MAVGVFSLGRLETVLVVCLDKTDVLPVGNLRFRLARELVFGFGELRDWFPLYRSHGDHDAVEAMFLDHLPRIRIRMALVEERAEVTTLETSQGSLCVVFSKLSLDFA